MHLLFFNLCPSCFLKLISNVLAFSYCRGWKYGDGVRRPNQVLGVLCRHHFLRWVTLPGEGQVPQLALTWELYSVAQALPEERVDGVLCEMVADIVFCRFWVISPLRN